MHQDVRMALIARSDRQRSLWQFNDG